MSDNELSNNDQDVEITEADLKEFQAFQVQKEAKKIRAQKKRITKAGNPDKRSESSKANVSKAREKVKEYLSMSKAVLDEDTDEEYIEIAVKKKEKKPVKYMETVKYEDTKPKEELRAPQLLKIDGVVAPTAPTATGTTPSVNIPIPVAPKKINTFVRF